MKAAICDKYGSPEVVKVANIDKPLPKKDEVLIKVYAASVSSGDARIRGFNVPAGMRVLMGLMLGFVGPRQKILGSQFAGEIEAIGKDVDKYKKGDKVYGITGMKFGCHAEYLCINQNGVMVKKPDNLSFDQAVPIPFGAMTALHLLRKGKIEKGQKVLIYGASGSVGTYAVQLAKYFGAEVTAVCSEANLELVRQLGADIGIDYTKDDFMQSGEKYDVIFDAVGKLSRKRSGDILTRIGRYISVMTPTTEETEKLEFLNKMVLDGKLKTVIDRTFELDDIVEAYRYVDLGHKKGNVVIRIKK